MTHLLLRTPPQRRPLRAKPERSTTAWTVVLALLSGLVLLAALYVVAEYGGEPSSLREIPTDAARSVR